MKVLFSAALLLSFAGPVNVTVGDLKWNGKKYDAKRVRTKGTVVRFEQRISKAGNSYFVFKLKDAKDEVNVYGRGQAIGIENDQRMEVVGYYRVSKKVGAQIFTNEIETTPDEVKPIK